MLPLHKAIVCQNSVKLNNNPIYVAHKLLATLCHHNFCMIFSKEKEALRIDVKGLIYLTWLSNTSSRCSLVLYADVCRRHSILLLCFFDTGHLIFRAVLTCLGALGPPGRWGPYHPYGPHGEVGPLFSVPANPAIHT